MQSLSNSPVSYYYLDHDGIHSLYAQSIGQLQTERSISVEKSIAGKVGVGAKLKNLLVKALLGAECEANGELSGSRKSTEQIKHVPRAENVLTVLLQALKQTGKPVFFEDLGQAINCLRSGREKVFIVMDDVFNAPQIQAGQGARSIAEQGYLILEKGMRDDYHYGDDYYKLPDVPLRLHAGVDKMPQGNFGGSGHLATRLRGHSGKNVRFVVFGAMVCTPAYFQIKPYAIWI